METTSTSSAHVPGPWMAKRLDATYYIVSEANPKITIASANGYDEEDDANARLLAAAPELLEALKAIEAIVDEDADMDHMLDNHDPESCTLCMARNAIAKAA